ncbi:SsrA-binding protein SmpB [Glutamicibacter sp. PS]|uniref:SsrA-binding protein SmpB n=1 Tax=Glutamicibacter TaxID=1742989 RepID=UPI00283CD802|nr:SsrA-binding protein SmpB [Glutamicibacter sp. PS]MDR4533185.1 SsrA-binding protein SmpB [Glutamicibacter sp. PS]
MAKKNQEDRTIATNRKARHDFEILDTFEAGMVLTGTEVKSLREGKASLVDGFGQFYRGELYIENCYIPEYLNGSWTNHAARRRRKLLLHRQELMKIERKVSEAGLTIVPLSLYFKSGRAKLEIGVARGKREFDKRQTLREKQDNREAQRAMRERNRRG